MSPDETTPLHRLQGFAAGCTPVAWLLPFVVVPGCPATRETGPELIAEHPIFLLPALVLPVLWFLLGHRDALREALRFVVAGLGALLAVCIPGIAVVGGGRGLEGWWLATGAWGFLWATGLALAGTRRLEARARPPRRWWVPPLSRGLHSVCLAGAVGGLFTDDLTSLLALVAWGTLAVPAALVLELAGREAARPLGRVTFGWAGALLAGLALLVLLGDDVRAAAVLGGWALVVGVDLALAHARRAASPA